MQKDSVHLDKPLAEPDTSYRVVLPARVIDAIMASVGLPNADMPNQDALERLVLATRDEVLARLPAKTERHEIISDEDRETLSPMIEALVHDIRILDPDDETNTDTIKCMKKELELLCRIRDRHPNYAPQSGIELRADIIEARAQLKRRPNPAHGAPKPPGHNPVA